MKITLLKSLVMVGAFLCFGLAQAQEVSGSVSDANGPLAGANVLEKGTTNGTQTDFDGNYTITVADGATLVFSYIGFETMEIAVAGQSTVNATLNEDAQALEEVVVVGYGSQQKKEITTAVTSVSEEDFNQGVVSNPNQLLQGKVAGLSVYNKGGDPNSNGVVRLRGLSTIGGNQEPLVVIDGVLGQSLNNVDPADIANITVLKDGSAAAIYGTRGSSGVILVTTKSGKTGQDLSVSYNGQIGVGTIANQIESADRETFLSVGGTDLGSETDWLDEVTETAITTVHNVAAVGGTEKANYRVSVNFRDEGGILLNTGFDQFNARTKFSGKLFNDKLNINFNSGFTQRDSNFGDTNALRYAVVYNPTAPIFGADAPFAFNSDQFGGYFETLGLFDSFNPVSIAKQGQNVGERTTVNYSLDFKYTVTDHITANLSFSDQISKVTNRQYFPTTAFFGGNALSPFRKGQANFYTNESRNKAFEFFGTYANTFNKLDFKFTGGYSYQDNDFNDYFLSLGDFPPGVDFDFSNQIEASQDLLEAGRVNANSSRNDDDRIIAFFGRINATFDNAIYFNASLRQEGSSRFGEDEQFGLFPAVAVGVDLNKYLQFENVDLLKVRLGYGVTGSIPGSVGLSQTTYSITNGDNGFGLSGTGLGSRIPNPGLKWEEKRELNLGFEYATERLSATLDIYNRDVVDFINLVTVENLGEGDQQFVNAGAINTKGLEFSVNYDVIKKDKLNYNTGVIFSTYKTILEENVGGDRTIANLGSPGQNSTNMIIVREGEEIGQIWGPVFTGEVDAVGAPILADLNGDGQVISGQDNALDEDADFAVLGNGIPDFEIGWTNQVSFGNWDVNAFFRGAFGHSLVNTFRAFYEPIIGSQTSYNFIRTDLARNDITGAQFSSYYVEKADFFRLDNLSVGYNMKFDNDYIKGARISLSGQNLFTITSYTGTDPEPSLSDFGTNPLAPGIDRRNNYFAARTFTLGLNLNF